jgi:hypothetical protein
MQSDAKTKPSKRTLFFSYSVGIALCAATQLAVTMQHGPRIYVSLLWAFLYPVQIYVAESCARGAIVAHIGLQDATAARMGIGISSILFGLILPALVGLIRSENRFARYVGIATLAVFVLLTIFWSQFPNVI